jgi:hypothetical protein
VLAIPKALGTPMPDSLNEYDDPYDPLDVETDPSQS